MLTGLYKRLLKLTSRPGEKGEYSGGYLQDRIRREALVLCRPSQGRALEIGCGEGLLLAQLEKENAGLKLWGVDNDDIRLKAASTRSGSFSLSNQDARKLSFEDGYFDVIICVNVLFNMPSKDDVRQILSEMKRVCKKGGSIIFDIRNSKNPALALKYRFAGYYDDTLKGLPLKTYSIEEIEALLKDMGMEAVVKKFIGFNSPIFSMAVIMEIRKPC
ncbi:MAG: class I SAM-dependent methyltransferase [Candidatus Omnitrophica bacterium]|nr:class I SAM-dependent methyltransferase [Candidatus Omnitrophota bacterium]